MTSARWEYRTLLLDVIGFAGPKVKPEAIERELNSLGTEGWELVSAAPVATSIGATMQLVAVLKRPLR